MMMIGNRRTVEDVDVDASRLGRGGGAGVVPRVRGQRPGDHEPRGARLLLRDHVDAAALAVVDDVVASVPARGEGQI